MTVQINMNINIPELKRFLDHLFKDTIKTVIDELTYMPIADQCSYIFASVFTWFFSDVEEALNALRHDHELNRKTILDTLDVALHQARHLAVEYLDQEKNNREECTCELHENKIVENTLH